jgi:flagellar protein FliS
MAYSNNSVHAYRETRVKTASQGRIIVMLYDEALRQIDEAVGLLDTGTKQLDRVNNSVVKAQDIITELMVSLDMEQGGDIARNLFACTCSSMTA